MWPPTTGGRQGRRDKPVLSLAKGPAATRTVDQAYDNARQGLAPKDAEEVSRVQAQWMKGREKCQQDADPTKCLEQYYQNHIEGIVQNKP